MIEGDDVRAHTRTFFKGQRLWQLLSITEAGKPFYDQTDRMFASFRFVQAR